MRVSDAREIVRLARVPPGYFSFDGELDEALCLIPIGPTWHVFLSERGRRYEELAFDSEDDACVYFLKRLFDLWSPS